MIQYKAKTMGKNMRYSMELKSISVDYNAEVMVSTDKNKKKNGQFGLSVGKNPYLRSIIKLFVLS